jgi:YesN/AraC family two-component response regulator
MNDLKELVKFTKTLKLLVVEDNQDSREQFVNMLSSLFDEIVSAVDGVDGLTKFKEGSFDLVISDVNMPKMNGLEMITKIREIDKEVIVMVVSAHNEGNFTSEAQNVHVNNYLFKPINLSQFIEALTQMMQDK